MDTPDQPGDDEAKGPHGVPAGARMTAPPVMPVSTQCRVKGIRLPTGTSLVAITMLTALGQSTYFFEPEVAKKIADSMIAEGHKANNMPVPVVPTNLIVPGNN